MTTEQSCPCCSGKSYKHCCMPFHTKDQHALTAEALMRSRYAAFAVPNAAYLMNTTLPAKRKFHNEDELDEWARINNWTKLEIIGTPSVNQVEFKAYFTDAEGIPQVHHELSVFQKMNGRWFYVSGSFPDDN